MSKRFLEVFCRHYKPEPGDPRCALGVDIRKHVGGDRFGWYARMPCVTDRPGEKPFRHDVVPCDKREPHTEAEIAEHDTETERLVARTLAIDPWVAAKKAAHPNGGSGFELCPGKCGQEIRWSIASSNGHMFAKCQTEGCIAFME